MTEEEPSGRETRSIGVHIRLEEKQPALPYKWSMLMSIFCVACGMVVGDWSDGVWFALGTLQGAAITAALVVRRNWRLRQLPENQPTFAIYLDPTARPEESPTRTH